MFGKFLKAIGLEDLLNQSEAEPQANINEDEEEKIDTSNPNKPMRSPIKGNVGDNRQIQRSQTSVGHDRRFS